MDFNKSIEAFLSTQVQQKKLRQHYLAAVRRGGSGGTALAQQDALRYAEEAKRFIIASLPDELKGGSAHPISESDLQVGPVEITPSGDFLIRMWWNPDSVHRESLYADSDEYREGLEDIVHLFAIGYQARNYAYGWWDGHSGRYSLRGTDNSVWVRSKISREPSPFLQAAVAAFNATYKKDNVRLTLNDDYLKRKHV